MLIYPREYEERLGIDQLFELVRKRCKSAYGEEFLLKVKPSDRYDDIRKRLQQTDEMRSILQAGEGIPTRDFYDIRPFLDTIRLEGAFLSAEDFFTLKAALTSLFDWLQFLKRNNLRAPELNLLSEGFTLERKLVEAIDKIVDDRGQVRDSASPELMFIRQQLIQKEKEVRTTINRIMKKAMQDKLAEEDSTVTVRDGRLVIPLKSENKRRIQGFVHDESASGQTVYLEPAEVLELNNEVRELHYQERREIVRILIALTSLVRQSVKDLERGATFLGLMDFIHAKARFAIQIEAINPKLQKYPVLAWKDARHPLMWLAHQETGKPTVPLSIKLSRNENRILVISGPNAGGKSVALKTIGMLQYLLQCGFLVPVAEGSEFGIFKNLFLDIGDTQSLENDLSTYSAHLTSMNYFQEMSDANTLFLIDEFGAGTEPQFGGAMAEAILDKLHQRKAFGIVTTHYQNLKKYAEQNAGVINGAMKYDIGALEPLFDLELGKPGSSFAFEIARKIGLPRVIIEDAKSKAGVHQVDYERLLNELEKERSKYRLLSQRAEKEEKQVIQIRSDYEALKAMLEKERKEILKKAKSEANQLLSEANRHIESTIREIKEAQADKERTKDIRQKLDKFKEDKLVEEKAKQKVVALKEGDPVTLVGQDTLGEILNIKGKQAQVRFGNLISYVDLQKLEKTKGSVAPAERRYGKRVGGIDWLDKMTHFSGELDIRGVRAEEALGMVDAYIDEALLLGTDQVRILHGKGHGILREVIRGHLKGHPRVGKAADEHIDFGGSGITVVTFK